jgi:hypothetical protein
MHFSVTKLALWGFAVAQSIEAHYRFSKVIVGGKLSGDFEVSTSLR